MREDPPENSIIETTNLLFLQALKKLGEPETGKVTEYFRLPRDIAGRFIALDDESLALLAWQPVTLFSLAGNLEWQDIIQAHPDPMEPVTLTVSPIGVNHDDAPWLEEVNLIAVSACKDLLVRNAGNRCHLPRDNAFSDWLRRVPTVHLTKLCAQGIPLCGLAYAGTQFWADAIAVARRKNKAEMETIRLSALRFLPTAQARNMPKR